MRKPSAKSLIFALLVALLISISQPLTAVWVVPLCLMPILISVLYAWAGWIPAAVASLGSVVSLTVIASQLGVTDMLGLFAAGCAVILVLPAAVSCWMLEKRQPFFRRMIVSAVVQTAALLGCTAVVYLGLKIDLVDKMIEVLRMGIDIMPAEARLTLLQNMAMQGLLTEESVEMMNTGFVTMFDLNQALDQALDTMHYMYKQAMPAVVLNSGLLSGVLMTTVPGLICARRGDEPQAEYIPMSGWFLPSSAVSGIAVCLISSYALGWMNVSGYEAVTIVFTMLGGTLLTLQGIAALSRGLKQAGRRRGSRIALITAALLFAGQFVQIAGAMSALFGRKGAISGWFRKRMEEKRKEDEGE